MSLQLAALTSRLVEQRIRITFVIYQGCCLLVNAWHKPSASHRALPYTIPTISKEKPNMAPSRTSCFQHRRFLRRSLSLGRLLLEFYSAVSSLQRDLETPEEGMYAQPHSTSTLPADSPPTSLVNRDSETSISCMTQPMHLSATVAWTVWPEAGLWTLIRDPHLGLLFGLPW